MTETFIHIKDLRLRAFHGVLPFEHEIGNNYVINIRVGYPWSKAATTDDVGDTLSYALLAETIKKEMDKPVQLIETVAQRICSSVKEQFPKTTSINLKITKLDPPMPFDCEGAGVEISMTF